MEKRACLWTESYSPKEMCVWQIVFNQRFANDKLMTGKLSKCLHSVVVLFYPWFKFSFLLFWGMVMYDNEFETKKKKLNQGKIEPQHIYTVTRPL